MPRCLHFGDGAATATIGVPVRGFRWDRECKPGGRMRIKKLGVTAVSVTAALVLAGCGGGSSGGSGSTSGASSRGPITYVQGKDNSGIIRPLVDQWNTKHPNEKVTFKEQS